MELKRVKDIDTFNIFVLHQNRVKHGEFVHIPETRLHNFLNLVIWGHEHECRISPEKIADRKYYISQPGKVTYVTLYLQHTLILELRIYLENKSIKHCSELTLGSSIATSLCEGESKPKHVGLLKINKDQFKMKALKLKSVRPFIFDNIDLRDHDIKIGDCVSVADSISQYVDRYIENEIMPRVAKQVTGSQVLLLSFKNMAI